MRKLVAALILVPLGVLLVALAVVNRKQVVLGLNPFDANAGFGIEAPLFLFLLGAFRPWARRRRYRDLARPGQVAENGAGRKPARPRPGAARPTAWRRSWKASTPARGARASPAD